MALLRNKRYSFLCHGIGTDILVKKPFNLGMFALSFTKTSSPNLIIRIIKIKVDSCHEQHKL